VSGHDELTRRFEQFASDTRSRSPLTASLSEHLSRSATALTLLAEAPAVQQNPVLLLAAIHDLLLAGADAALARHYPSIVGTTLVAPDELHADLERFLALHHDDLLSTMRERRVQTNEIGRCATFLPGLGLLAEELGPLALVDVGTSAGLNLLLDRYEIGYSPGGTVAPADAASAATAVHLACSTRGGVPVPARMPTIAARVGLDLGPIDVHDEASARWLQACVWPDQLDRLERLRRAIAIARAVELDLLTGDAVDGLPLAVARAAAHDASAHPVVMNSWVLSYLTHERRVAYVDQLDAIGAARDLSWLYAESPGDTTGLPTPRPARGDGSPEHITVLALVRWRGGRRSVERLATAHPHGYWLHWGA
jgi:hypothetical protein